MDVMENRERRPLILPFLLIAFVWTTGLLSVVIALRGSGSDPSSFPPWIYAVIFAAGFGPSLAAFLLIRPAGRRGEFRSRFRRSPSHAMWFLIPPVVVAVIAASTWGIDRALGIPSVNGADLLRLLPLALIWPLFSAFGEEFGWRGFLLPVLRERYGPVTSSVILGFLWGVWHIPALWLALGNFGAGFWAFALVGGIAAAVVNSLLITWIHEKSGGNLPMVIWFHYCITAAAVITGKPDLSFREGIIHASVGVTAGGVIALLILVLDGRSGRSMSEN
jgi:membrane protease YdiL (CAAX protease family)